MSESKNLEMHSTRLKQSKFIFLAAGITALAGLLFGYDTGVISGAILFIKKDFQLGAAGEGLVVSAVLLGATFSSMASGNLTEAFGRKKVILVLSVIFALGSILTAFANSTATLIIGRIGLGIAIGVASFAAPLYIGEISPPRMRGALVGLNQLAITCGILFSYIVDYIFAASGNWQAMVGLGAIPGLILGVGMCFMPESPRWLMLKGKETAARQGLQMLRATKDVDDELMEIKQTFDAESGGWQEIASPMLRPVLFIGAALAVFQQFTGINTVIYYAPTIFNFAGFASNSASILATALVGIVNVVMTIVGLSVIDKVGRRPLLLVGLTGMAISLFVLALGFMSMSQSHLLQWIGVFSLMFYVASFAISIGPIFWLLIAEIYPLRVRGLAMSIISGICWVSNLVVSFSFPILIKYFGPVFTFSIYGVISVIAICFCYFRVPETKGLSLEEIQESIVFGRKKVKSNT